jgi:hypothetical protein
MISGSEGHKLSFNNPYIKKQAMHGKLMGTYKGLTRDTQDAQRRGRIAVFIPSFFDHQDADDKAVNWLNCEWTSPFWGKTYRGYCGTQEKNYTDSQSTYGMWMVPPDPGTPVLVSFLEGNIKFPVIISCLIEDQYNYAVPGFPGGVSYGDPAVNAPVGEKNLAANPGDHANSQPRPIQADIAEYITKQGLILDSLRGAGSSGARRESPSNVFGIVTPGDWDPREPAEGEGKVRLAGHQLIMDDKLGNKGIRIRTGGGNQILMSDDGGGSIYMINKRGTAWFEMDGLGNMNFFAEAGIHVRTKGDFNLRADQNINFEAGGDVNIKAAGDMRGQTYVGGLVAEAAGALGLPTLGTGGRVNITGKQSLQLFGDRNVRLTARDGDIDISSGGATNITANGLGSTTSAAAINLTTPASSILMTATQYVQVQSPGAIFLTAPAIQASGGTIGLNTVPVGVLTPGIALAAFRLNGKPLSDVDSEPPEFNREAAKQGVSAFPTQGKRDNTFGIDKWTICTKLMTPEPWVGHGQYDPIEKASDPEFNEDLAKFLPPGSSGDTDNPAPGDVVVTDPDTGQSVVKKGLGYVDEAGKELKSAADQVKDAYDQTKGEFQAEIDAVKADLAEQFPEYEEYGDVANNVSKLFDSDLSAVQRVSVAIDILKAVVPPIRFPTSNQLEEEIAGLDSKLTELEAKLAEFGLDADALMADLLTGNIAGLKSQVAGAVGEAVAEGLNNSELTAKLAEDGITIDGLNPLNPDGTPNAMFPSVAYSDKNGNTVVDFSKGLSDPAATLLAAGKLNTQFSELQAEYPNLPLGDTQQSGLISFVDGIGGPDKLSNSNVGQELKRASEFYGQSTPEGTAAGNAVMANVPRLMSGWVLAAEKPGGAMVYNEDLYQRRQTEIALLTATDDMNLDAALADVKPGSLTYGDVNARLRAQKEIYFADRQPTGTDSEFGKLVTSASQTG